MKRNKKYGKALFSNLFGESTRITIVDFLVGYHGMRFTLTHIENGIGISRTTIRKHMEELIEIGLVEISKKDNKSKYYSIKKNTKEFTLLYKLHRDIGKNLVGLEGGE